MSLDAILVRRILGSYAATRGRDNQKAILQQRHRPNKDKRGVGAAPMNARRRTNSWRSMARHGASTSTRRARVVSRHVTSRHVTSCMSCHVMSCPVLSCPVLSCPVLSCPVLSRRVMSRRVASCHVMMSHLESGRVVSCRVVSCPVVSGRFSLPDVVSCCCAASPDVVSCLLMTCHVMSRHAMSLT